MSEKENIDNYIGIFPNAATPEYCDRIIKRFEYLKKTRPQGRGKIWTRQESEDVDTLSKNDETYFMGGDEGDNLPFTPEENVLMNKEAPLLQEFSVITWRCYDEFIKKYGSLKSVGYPQMSSSIRLQKSLPGQGYHMWHADGTSVGSCRRLLAAILYLNTVQAGGETEFLYQALRVPPKKGTLILFPTAWTHVHRGNPPLKGDKYILTTWLELTK